MHALKHRLNHAWNLPLPIVLNSYYMYLVATAVHVESWLVFHGKMAGLVSQRSGDCLQVSKVVRARARRLWPCGWRRAISPWAW